jgi:hypothetical protein
MRGQAREDNAESTTATEPARTDQPTVESAGQRRRREARQERRARERSAPAASSEPAAAPRFWFGFEVAWAKLALGRFVLFGMLAVDALMQISHAPRYSAGDFNVAQLPLLDAIAPGRTLYAIAQLVDAYLFVLVACGAATRYVLPVVTAIYGWLYFSSHLDSYQHHYLVWLTLVLSCFVPWERPADAGPPEGDPPPTGSPNRASLRFGERSLSSSPATRVRSWALRLLLVEIALMYFWAAISKMSPAWVDGRTLSAQIHGEIRRLIDATVGIKGAAIVVLVVELVLAATVWLPSTWPIAAPLGIALHVGILVTDLEIGLFAWLMFAMYIFVVPDRVWVWLAERPPLRALRGVAGALRGLGRSWVVWIFAAGIGVLLAAASRFDHGALVGVVLLGALAVATVVLRARVAIAWLATAHLLAFTTWTLVDRTTSQAADYYRFWGGSSRRLGDVKTAEYAYRKMIEVAPREGQGHYQLGRLLLQRNADEEGLAAIRRAQDLEPMRARAYVAEARWLAAHGKRDEALAKAREATIVEPNDSEARTLLDSLTKTP